MWLLHLDTESLYTVKKKIRCSGIPRYFTKYKPTKLEELKDEDGQLTIPDEIGQVHACQNPGGYTYLICM